MQAADAPSVKTNRLLLCAALAGAAISALAPSASASMIVGRNAGDVSLRIDRAGTTALVTYTEWRSHRARHVLAWGAKNWGEQFRVDFSGGWGSKRADWRRFPDHCLPYSGPELPLAVAACDAPDGTHWALQRWQRLLPNYGGRSAASELHLSHWNGASGSLEVHTDWGYFGMWRHLYGRFLYHGKPVFGLLHTPTGVPLDRQGRNVYVDYLRDGVWQRENSFLTHPDTAGFCYLFSRHAGRVGNGIAYRATAIGPGVSPIVSAQFSPPPAYSRQVDAQANAEQRALLSFGGRPDHRCKIN
jgi:hypothetical protein